MNDRREETTEHGNTLRQGGKGRKERNCVPHGKHPYPRGISREKGDAVL